MWRFSSETLSWLAHRVFGDLLFVRNQVWILLEYASILKGNLWKCKEKSVEISKFHLVYTPFGVFQISSFNLYGGFGDLI